jgi:hypothetical protein
MQATIILADGRNLAFPNADVQRKENGKVIAVFDASTYRIVEEFPADQVVACNSRSSMIVATGHPKDTQPTQTPGSTG